MEIRSGDVSDPRVIDLLREHLAGMHASSPPGSVYALDLDGLQQPSITFLTIWDGDELLGCGALKQLDAHSGELKSMRVTRRHLGRGAGRAMLERLIAIARERAYTRLSLETGTGEAFEAAVSLYRRAGFANGPAFGGYAASEFNQFLHLELT